MHMWMVFTGVATPGAHWLNTHFAGALPSTHVPCTQHVVGQLGILLLAHILKDNGKLQLLKGFRIRQRNCADMQHGMRRMKRRQIVVVKAEDVPSVPTFPQPMIQQLADGLKVSVGFGSLTGATSCENVIFFFSLTKARSFT